MNVKPEIILFIVSAVHLARTIKGNMTHDLFRSTNHISLPLKQAQRQLPFRQGAAGNRLCTLKVTVAGPSEAELSEKAAYDRQPGG
jgi:hypothetical protein